MLKIKNCPACGRTYSDNSIAFCLKDGSLLSAPEDAQTKFNFVPDTNPPKGELDTVISQSNKLYKKRLKARTENDKIYFGDNFSVSFQRTLRIPDDGEAYPLPPGLGKFPIFRVKDYADRVPESWVKHKGVFIPMYQREALWINFDAVYWRPNAVKIAAGMVNAVTGESWSQHFSQNEQDYMVCPPQEWIDGFKTSKNIVRQFVAIPLGMGYTVEAQLTGEENFGGIQIIVFEPKKGRFSKREPERDLILKSVARPTSQVFDKEKNTGEMGLAAGGKIEQKIYPDKYGVSTWDENHFGRLYVHIVNSMMFREITGLEPPSTPISAKTYAEYNLPWFKVYDEDIKDVPTSENLYEVKSVKFMDKIKGFSSQEDDSSIEVSKDKIIKLNLNSNEIDDGEW